MAASGHPDDRGRMFWAWDNWKSTSVNSNLKMKLPIIYNEVR